jgi:hypothetical protein
VLRGTTVQPLQVVSHKNTKAGDADASVLGCPLWHYGMNPTGQTSYKTYFAKYIHVYAREERGFAMSQCFATWHPGQGLTKGLHKRPKKYRQQTHWPFSIGITSYKKPPEVRNYQRRSKEDGTPLSRHHKTATDTSTGQVHHQGLLGSHPV